LVCPKEAKEISKASVNSMFFIIILLYSNIRNVS